MRNSVLNESQAIVKIAGGNIINLWYSDHTALMTESKHKLKASPWDWQSKVRVLAWHTALKGEYHGICAHCLLENRMKINDNNERIWFSWASRSSHRVTASIRLKDACFLVGKLWQTLIQYKKAETSSCEQKFLIEAMVFPAVMHGSQRWTIMKAELQELMLLNCDAERDFGNVLKLKECLINQY